MTVRRMLGDGPAAALRRMSSLLILALLCAAPGGPAVLAQEPVDEEWVDEDWVDEDWDDEEQWDDDEPWEEEGWADDDWEDGELVLDEDLTGGDLDPMLEQTLERYAGRLYRNRDRGYEQMIEGLGYLRELSFNESMRATKKDFFELFGEALGNLILGGMGLDLPKIVGLDLTDLPSVIPLLEAWGEEVSPSRRTPTVGDWVQAQWDHLRRRKAELPDPDVLVEELRESYLALDADARFDFELWLDGALETEEAYREPDPLLVEQRFWEAWINSHFAGGDLDSSKCHDTRGCLEIWLEPGEYLLRRPDFSLAAAAVEVPGADVVTAGLTRIMREADQADRGSWRRRVRILDFAVPKRVCFGSFSDWSAEQQLVDGAVGFLEDLAEATGHELPPPRKPPCGWLGPDNETLVAPEDSEIRELFTDRTWRSAGGGASFGVHGWS